MRQCPSSHMNSYQWLTINLLYFMEKTVATNEELQAIREVAIPKGVGIQTTVYADKARNAEVWDVEGNRYIDLAAGIAVCNTGHNHPDVIAAVSGQLLRFSHTCFQVAPYDVYVKLADRLAKAAPGNTPKKTIFLATGAAATLRGVIILTCGVRANVIRFLPPLTIGPELLAEALTIISDIIQEKAGVIRKAS